MDPIQKEAEVLTVEKIRTETAKMMAEIEKTRIETTKIANESAKLIHEIGKMNDERREIQTKIQWHPLTAIAAAVGATAAIIGATAAVVKIFFI